MFSEINRLLGTSVLILVVILACIDVPMPALAATIYDGDWNVLIRTHGGACDPTLRFGAQIADGIINNGVGIATVQGRVTPKGTVRVTVRSGSQWADGFGLLSRNRGSGARRGQGTNGVCRGSWVAERRD
jgi:hypothetical protein